MLETAFVSCNRKGVSLLTRFTRLYSSLSVGLAYAHTERSRNNRLHPPCGMSSCTLFPPPSREVPPSSTETLWKGAAQERGLRLSFLQSSGNRYLSEFDFPDMIRVLEGIDSPFAFARY